MDGPKDTKHRVAATMVYLPGIKPGVVHRERNEIGADQCTATSKSTGSRCQLKAVIGTTVCHLHGAAKGTPARDKADRTVAASIRARLEKAASRAMTFVEEVIDDEGADDRTRLQASRDVLDRAGFVAVRKQEVEVHTPGGRTVDEDIDELLAKRQQKAAGDAG